jgi:hypothetical protein
MCDVLEARARLMCLLWLRVAKVMSKSQKPSHFSFCSSSCVISYSVSCITHRIERHLACILFVFVCALVLLLAYRDILRIHSS